MLTIELSNLRFHAYHGYYSEEKTLGGEYEVNVTVWHNPSGIPVLHIDDTIDYTLLFGMIREIMDKPKPLLETIASTIASEILHTFSQAEEVMVSITKLN